MPDSRYTRCCRRPATSTPPNYTFPLSQSGSSVTGTETSTDAQCGAVVWQITGQTSGGGLFTLTESNPRPVVDACGRTAVSASANLQVACSSATGTPISSTGGGRSALTAAASTTLTWTRTSDPPGMTVTFDIIAGTITTQLSGTELAGTNDVQVGVKRIGDVATEPDDLGLLHEVNVLRADLRVPAEDSSHLFDQ